MNKHSLVFLDRVTSGRPRAGGPVTMPVVPRQPRLAWLLAFVLTVAGWISAHEVAYRLALPHPHASGSDLVNARHAYLAYASFLVVLCLFLAVLCMAGLALRHDGVRPPSGRLLLLFVLLPPLGFALQEVIESLLTGSLPVEAGLESTFLVGILLQVPFAVVALVVARLFFAAARSIARRGEGPGRPKLLAFHLSLSPAAEAWPPRPPALAFGYGERGPPAGFTAL
jgi:hypothetical protein